MLDKLQLEHVGPVDRLSADFAERLNVITGDNGLGKSFLLDVCFWTLTGTWPDGRTALPESGRKAQPKISYTVIGKKGKTEEKSATFDFHSQSWTRLRGRPPMPGLVVYAAVDGGFAVWDPARNYWRDPATGKTETKERPDAFQFSPETLANGLEVGDRKLCNGLVQDWVEWFYVRSSEPLINPFEYLEDVIRVLSHPTEPIGCEEPRKVFVDDIRKFPTLKEEGNDELAYEWNNFRYGEGVLNGRKWKHIVLDPFLVQDGWFKIQLPDLQLVATNLIPQQHRTLAVFTLKKLGLGDDEVVVRYRKEWFDMYRDGKLQLDGLRDVAPLIADAVERDLHNGKDWRR